MRRLCVLCALAATALPAAAAAGTCNGEFGWLAKGTVYPLEERAFIFTGEFSGTFFNAEAGDPTHRMTTQCPGLWHVKDGPGVATGACIMKDADGDKIILEWSGTGDFPEISGPFEIAAGTGKFAGISGQGMFKGVSVARDAAGNAMGYATWRECSYTTGE